MGVEPGPAALARLAAAVAASLPPLPRAVLVARAAPRPVLALLGDLEVLSPSALAAQARALPFALRNLRLLTHADVESACRRLADRLREVLTAEQLTRASVRFIPRGGAFVLGHLSYLLSLRPDQLLDPPGDGPRVIVDDCALSGLRLRGLLPRLAPNGPVLFAPAFAPQALLDAVEASEPRVTCVTGQELEEAETEALEPGWRERWTEHRGGFWTGRPPALAFPWSEPERVVFDPETRTTEVAWKLTVGGPPYPLQPEPAGPLRPADTVVFGEWAGDVLVGETGSGRCVRLTGTAAEMWRGLIETGTARGAAARLADRFAVDETRARDDVEGWVGELRREGLWAAP